MRNRLLALLTLLLVAGGGIFAQTWTAPERPTPPEGSDPVSGEVYRVMNVDAGQFLAGGASWYSWATSAVLAEVGSSLEFTLTYVEDEEFPGWTIARTSDGKFTFVSGAKDGLGEMHVDMASQGHNYFEFVKQDNGFYHIRVVSWDDTYGSDYMEGWADKSWGWQGPTSTYPTAVYATANPADGFYCDWAFVKQSAEELADYKPAYDLYKARLGLYAKAMEAAGYSIDYSIFTEAYEGEDMEAMEEAVSQLDELIELAKVYAVLQYGEDGVNPPSEDNPANATSLIKNAAFDEGTQWQQPPYWTVEAMGQNNCWNGDSYTNEAEGITLSKFMESWIDAASTLKDGAMYQTLKSLPSGKYKMGVDAMTNRQGQESLTITGVELFATGGEITTTATVSTPYLTPQHFDLTFISAGGDMTLGLRTRSTNANWILADNFTLTYYGEVADVYEVALQALIEKLEAQYAGLDEIYANAGVKEAFTAEIEAAKATTSDFQAEMEKLQAAADALETSISDYQHLHELWEQWGSKRDEVDGTKWAEAGENIADKLDEMDDAYQDGTWTAEDINEAENFVSNVFADVIGELVEKGDDLTFLLNNPGFDTSFSGWQLTEDSTPPVWGGLASNGGPLTYQDAEGNEKTLESGNAERYHATFDMYQTIRNMPAGIFTLSCQAFERDDNGQGIDAELYAILGNDSTNIQIVKLKDLHAEQSPVQLYSSSVVGGADTNYDSPYNGGYVPNGMVGANIYFAEGFYKNYFNITLQERTDIAIGVRTASEGDWVLFDDFKIVYKGDDASAYQETIERLMAENETLQNADGIFSQAALKGLEDSHDEAGDLLDAIDDASKEEALAIIEKLNEAIAYAQESLTLSAKLASEVEMTQYSRIDYDQKGEHAFATSDSQLDDLLSELQGKLDEADFAENSEFEDAIVAIRRAYTNYVMCDIAAEATEENFVDVTAVIYNYQNEDYDETAGINGWTTNPGTAKFGDGVAEFFNQGYLMSQTIYGLKAGYYRLYVQGFYRHGDYAVVAEELNGEEPVGQREAYLFADSDSTRLALITDEMAAYTALEDEEATGAKITVDETDYTIPNNTAQAAKAFEYELFDNCLQFQVAEGQESVTIGLKKAAVVQNDWTIWDNWRLYYLGTTEPSEDATTAIAGVEATPVQTVTIYNLAGQRVQKAQKGIYIINGKKVVIR